MAKAEIHHRWEWAGIAVRDEEGNLLVLEMDNPSGAVIKSVDLQRVRDWSGKVIGTVPGDIRLSVHLEGIARQWDGRVREHPVRALADNPPLPIESGE